MLNINPPLLHHKFNVNQANMYCGANYVKTNVSTTHKTFVKIYDNSGSRRRTVYTVYDYKHDRLIIYTNIFKISSTSGLIEFF